MKPTVNRFKAIPRLAVAILGHLFLFAWWRSLFLWKSRASEAWEFFKVGSVSAAILVLTVAVIMRGSSPEKVAAVMLSLLPAICLALAVVVYVNEFL